LRIWKFLLFHFKKNSNPFFSRIFYLIIRKKETSSLHDFCRISILKIGEIIGLFFWEKQMYY